MTMKEILNGGFPSSDSKITNMPEVKVASQSAQKKAKVKAKRSKAPAIPLEDSPCVAKPDTATSNSQTGMTPEATSQEKHMILNFKSLDKRGRNAIFTGAAVSLRFPIGAFPDKTAPATLDVVGLAEKVAKTPRAQMTKEERKAARAAMPALTLAEKVAKQEERAARLRAQLEASNQASI